MQALKIAAAAAAIALSTSAVRAQEIVPEDVPVVPRPAEIMPLASKHLLLDVVNSGKRYIAVGDRGHILGSIDGRNWAQVQVPVRAALTAVSFVDDQHGWAAGHDATILRTEDGGRSWQLQNFEPDLEVPFLDVLFTDTSTGYAIGAYGLFYATDDGGVTWSEVDAGDVTGEELHLNRIVKLNNGDLLIVGETGMMGVSSDGQEWERLESPYESSLFGATPMGDGGALVYGLRGNAYVTDDVRSGQWRKLDTGTVASLFGGTSLPGGGAAMVGLSGTILEVGPGATQVRARTAPAGKTLSAAVPTAEGLLVVGDAGASVVKHP